MGGDPGYFDGWLAKLIRLREQTCRDPFCDAPIRHLDHITRTPTADSPHSPMDAAPASRGNQVREMPGWHLTLIDCGFHGGPHKIIITTPTGHRYCSRAPAPP